MLAKLTWHRLPGDSQVVEDVTTAYEGHPFLAVDCVNADAARRDAALVTVIHM